MLELKITITSENADKVIRLIQEIMGSDVTKSESPQISKISDVTTRLSLLSRPSQPLQFTKVGKIEKESTTAKYMGSWGQFNSFFPVKAVLRVLSNSMSQNEQAISLQVLLERSLEAFKERQLQNFRGFPKNYRRDSSVGRLVGHFISTSEEMGLIAADGEISTAPHSWANILLSVTKEGWEFAELENNLFDYKAKEQVLTKSEKAWMINYLRQIDVRGFKEFSLLNRVYEQLKKGNQDISNWLKQDNAFKEYVQSWSRKDSGNKEFEEQLETVSNTFAQSKIALLRELGVIKNQRGDYTLIGSLGDYHEL